MHINELHNKTEYDKGLSKIPHNERHFLQSYEYGLLQRKIGNTPIFLGFFDEKNEILSSMLFIIFHAKRGTYLFCPYGVFDEKKLSLTLAFFKNKAKELKIDFIRLSPLMEDLPETKKLFTEHGFFDAPVHMMHPELCWFLDLDKKPKTLLNEMRKNNRYGISKAKKDGVTIKAGCSGEMLDTFYYLHEETAKRQKFVPWGKDFLSAQREVFAPYDQIRIFLAYYNNKPIAGAVIMYYENTAYYHHGASLSQFNKIPSSYLIQWEAIMEAKNRGMRIYDFYGIIEDNPKHPWAGLSFFKKGFGGKSKKIIHCLDLPITKKYRLNWIIEKWRKYKRGY